MGDIGDYVKLAILRSLAPRHKLGIAWWLHPDELKENNGRHTDYLKTPGRWRHFDPPLFDFLETIALSDHRNVAALEHVPLLSDATFHNKPLLINASPEERRRHRIDWFRQLKATLAECDVVFLDPDNGLEPGNFNAGLKAGAKSIALAELKELDVAERTLIVYHHQTRRKGGHKEELRYWAEQLKKLGFKNIDAIRSKSYSSRFFFFLNATILIRDDAERLVRHWHPHLEWFPCLESSHESPAADVMSHV